MSYLKNSNNRVVVDAILTSYGKTKLSLWTAKGNPEDFITKFAVADDEIDYGLYNDTHPDGSDFYGSALINLPILQALPEQHLSMKYPLFSSSTRIDAISTLRLTFANVITGSGVSDYTEYSITPSFYPTPGDITRIYYVAKITIPEPIGNGGDPVPEPDPVTLPPVTLPPGGAQSRPIGSVGGGDGATIGTTSDGTQFTLQSFINPNIGLTPQIIAARGFYRDTAKYKYAVGHGCNFKVTRFGRDGIMLQVRVTAYGINGKSANINIKVNGREVADPDWNVKTQVPV